MSTPIASEHTNDRAQGGGGENMAGEGVRPLPVGREARAGIKILIIDDEHTLREGCASVLQGEGYDVSTSGRGQEALDILKRRPFDIVLTDLYMSQVSGMELMKAALATNRDAIVIVMTGNPSLESSIDALRHGAWDYLPKPFSASHLQILIGRAAHTLLVSREKSGSGQDVELDSPGGGAGETLPMLGSSPMFRDVIALAKKVAPPDA